MKKELPAAWSAFMAIVMTFALTSIVFISIANAEEIKEEKKPNFKFLDDTIEEIEAQEHQKNNPEAWRYKKR